MTPPSRLPGLCRFAESHLGGPRNPGERGATLAELLIALTVSITVVAFVGSAVYQFLSASRIGNDRLTVLTDLQDAALWLGRDASEAASFTPGVGSTYGTLRWADSSVEYRYLYDAATSALVREEYADGVLQSSVTAARHIAAQGDVAFGLSGALLRVSVTSTWGTASRTADVSVALRVP
jgi:Tfp pilus assembly protein PilW